MEKILLLTNLSPH